MDSQHSSHFHPEISDIPNLSISDFRFTLCGILKNQQPGMFDTAYGPFP